MVQGGVLSPTLFLIMFNDLINKLDVNEYQVFAYADDLAVIGKNKENLKRAIKLTEE